MRSADIARITAFILAGAVLFGAGGAHADHDREPEARRQSIAKKARKSPEPPKAAIPEDVPAKASDDGDFTSALKSIVKAKSAAFCDRYSGAEECIEDIEICLTMLDRDEDTVRVCMTMQPREHDKPRAASVRR
jgi:hypothetical protein